MEVCDHSGVLPWCPVQLKSTVCFERYFVIVTSMSLSLNSQTTWILVLYHPIIQPVVPLLTATFQCMINMTLTCNEFLLTCSQLSVQIQVTGYSDSISYDAKAGSWANLSSGEAVLTWLAPRGDESTQTDEVNIQCLNCHRLYKE